MIDRRAERPGATIETGVLAVEGGRAVTRSDRVATEEPLEIRMRAQRETRTVAITMRTPGHDFELAAGFLHNEGVVGDLSSVRGITYCIDPAVDPEQQYNIVNVDLAAAQLPPLDALERHFTTTSACGVCGKASLEALAIRGFAPLTADWTVDAATIVTLPDALRGAQGIFEKTGGLHAAALFDRSGLLHALREDVGRHNAVDKLVGWAVMNKKTPLREGILMVSGRSSYEIVQKALAAGIPVLCAVSAPSSLAIALAREFGITLIGFLRGSRFNVYTHPARVRVG